MFTLKVKKIIRYAFRFYRKVDAQIKTKFLCAIKSPTTIDNIDFNNLKNNTLNFVKSMKTDHMDFQYRYSDSSSMATLYSSVYACMTLSLLGELHKRDAEEKRKWAEYFNSFQNSIDGLFYDPAITNSLYKDGDWWGARHLALHLISAYSDIGFKPKYEFSFLKQYYNTDYIESWLNAFDWESASIGADDIDNKIMNIGCLLQYQRDYWNDPKAGAAVEFLKKYLKSKINTTTGMWGGFDTKKADQLSRMIQFAYHIFPIFFYDNEFDMSHEKIIRYTLNTQNKLGGFSPHLNSSACEDIDSIDILIRLASFAPHLKKDIDNALRKAFSWVLYNQMKDGGFVFKLYEPLTYGHVEMSNKKNESSMFPTWFRTLSIAYIERYFYNTHFNINKSPGLEQ